MAALTSSSSPARARTNLAAQAAALCGLLAVAALPGGIAAARYLQEVRLLDGAMASVPAAFALGLLAVVAGRRARRRLQLSLGRAGGEGAARAGRALGFVGLYLGCTGGIALGFYELLRFYS
jgi:hypothetical protein